MPLVIATWYALANQQATGNKHTFNSLYNKGYFNKMK